MRTIKVAAAAREDLEAIWSYVAERDAEVAGKLVKEIVGKFAVLRDYPQMGREQYDLLINLRSFTVKGYIIFYQPMDDGIEVLHVLHGSQDAERIFAGLLDSI